MFLKKSFIAVLSLIFLCSSFTKPAYSQELPNYVLPRLMDIVPLNDQISIDQLIELLPAEVDLNAPQLILVNRENQLDREPDFPIAYSETGLPYSQVMEDALKLMRDEASLEGYYYNFISGYRSFATQAELRQNRFWMNLNAGYSEDEANYLTDLFVAPAQGSEHTTGLAVDLTSATDYDDLTTDMQYSPAMIWLAENAHRYGFILRYTEGKTDITGINFEPWHFRYVGNPHATFMHEYGLVFEEYIALVVERDQRKQKFE